MSFSLGFGQKTNVNYMDLLTEYVQKKNLHLEYTETVQPDIYLYYTCIYTVGDTRGKASGILHDSVQNLAAKKLLEKLQ